MGQRALAIAVLLAMSFSTTIGQTTQLECEDLYCRATGTVGLDNLTYPYTVPSRADFDLYITVSSRRGDVDLMVTPPNGAQARRSEMRAAQARSDFVSYSREDLRADPGVYMISVVSNAMVESDFVLEVHRNAGSSAPPLAAKDQAALETVLGACCAERGACPQLRAALGAQPSTLCTVPPNACSEQGHLTHLSLVSEGLACLLPPALSQLHSLRRLDLTFNKIQGSFRHDVAPVLAEMPSLERVNLGYNQIQGELDCGAFPMAEARLVELDVAENTLAGSIPACLLDISSLRELYLAGNKLTGQLPGPPKDSQLTTLSVADQKSDEGLSGDLPSFASAKELRALRLHGNGFSRSLPQLPPSIQEVRLSRNQLTGGVPSSYARLGSLHTLKAEQNRLSGTIPDALAVLEALQILDLSYNQLSGSLPAHWDTPRLVELDLQSNALTGPLPAGLAQLPRLSYLQLQENQLSGTLDAYSRALHNCSLPSSTRFLSLGGNQLAGSGLKALGAFKPGKWNIIDGWLFEKTLNLSHNSLSGPLPVWALQELAAGDGLTVKLEGNHWDCPKGRISVAADINTLDLGEVVCRDPDGPSDATSRHAIANLLTIEPAKDLQPGEPSASEVEALAGAQQTEKVWSVNGRPDLQLPLENLSNDEKVWDAAWGEKSVDDSWADADARAPLPIEEHLEGGPSMQLRLPSSSQEQPDEAPAERHAPPVPELPDWAPRPRKAYSRSAAKATPQAAAHAAPSLPGYPSEEASGGDLADIDSWRGSSSRDVPKQANPAKGRAGDATMLQQQGRPLPRQEGGAGEGTPGGSREGQASGGAVESAGAGRMQEERRGSGGALIIAALVVILAGAVLAAGYAALRQFRRRRQLQGLLYQDVEGPGPGLGALELQRSSEYMPPGEPNLATGECEALLGKPSGDGRCSPVISLTAHAGGAAPAVHWPPAPDAADVQLKLPLA